MDTSSWENGTYVGYSYATDWAGNTFRAGPSAPFDVDITRLESGSLAATFTSVGPGQFEMSVTGRIVDATGNGVVGENLHLNTYRGVRTCNDALCTTTTLGYTNLWDYTIVTDGSGYFNYTAPTATLLYENPIPSVHTTDRYFSFVYDSSNNQYGYVSGDLDDPPLQSAPSQYANSTWYSLISNLSTKLDPYGSDWQITVSGNLIRVDGQPAANVPIRFRTYSYNTVSGSWEFNTSPTYFETTTGAYGEFSMQLPTVLPAGSYWFRVYFYSDTYENMGSIYYPDPTGTIQYDLH
jgi:hypothetical protein